MSGVFLPLTFMFLYCSSPASAPDLSRQQTLSQYSSLTATAADTLPYERTVDTGEPGKLLGHFSSGGWDLDWYEGMLVGTAPGSTTPDTIYEANESVTYTVEDPSQPDTMENHFSERYRTLSIVGDVVSYEMSYEGDGGAHPVYGSSYNTVRLGTKIEYGSGVDLTEFFAEGDIFRALMWDSTIIRSLPKGFHPKNLDDMVKHLDGGCEVSFDYFLKHWEIDDCVNGLAYVVFGLTHGCEVMRGRFTTIEITLPIPKESEEYLEQTRRAGTYGEKMAGIGHGIEY